MSIKKFLVLVFTVIFFLRFLVQDLGILGRALVLSIEGLSVLTLVLFTFGLAKGQKLSIPSKYALLFIVFVLSVVGGVFANDVQPGAVFSGVRNVFMYLPYFLLPAMFTLKTEELAQLLRLICVFAVVQIPITIFQWKSGMRGGTMDHVHGTLSVSSYLSIFLICCIAVAWSYLLAGRIKKQTFVLLALLFLAPTTLNETKGTLILLPFAFLVPSIIMAIQNNNYRLLLATILTIIGVGTIFLTAFSLFLSDLNTANLAGFFLEGEFIDYLYSQADENAARDFGVFNEVGRIDAIVFALRYLSKDVVHFFFGYGLGNVSESFSSITLGEYGKYQHLGPQISTISLLLWETGVIGVSVAIAGCFMIFKDSYIVAKSTSPLSVFARGWAGVVTVMIIALPYKNLLISDVIGILFWFFSGVIIAERVRFKFHRKAA